jgi:mannosyltransferase
VPPSQPPGAVLDSRRHATPKQDSSRGELVGLAALIVAAAAVRLVAIGDQSFWLDESFTVELAKQSFGDMLSGVSNTESTPPLYYVLAWLWAKVFATDEAGLRSLSALFGTLAVPVAWRAAREWFDSPRAGLIAAALVAFNPFFVWYSQEARSYSLLVLMAVLSLLFLGRALRDRTARAYALWALTAGLALLTHYFAAFLLLPEAIWLVWATRDRAAWVAAGGLALVAAALAPLAIHQRDLGHTEFIGDLGPGRRIADIPKKLVTGELGTPTPLIGPLAGLIAAAAIVWAIRSSEDRRRALTLVALAAAAAAVPLVLALIGSDYLLPRNLIAIYVPIVLVVAAGLARAGALGTIGAVAICAVAVAVNVEVTQDEKLQRDDWRSAAQALGAPTEPRAVIVSPDYARKPLRLYAGSLAPLPPGALVKEVDLIVNARPAAPPPAPPPGWTAAGTITTPSYVLARYRSAAPVAVDPAAFPTPKPPAILLQRGPSQ